MTFLVTPSYLIFFLIVCNECSESPKNVPVAFPGADGFGKFTTGGRAGRILAVTNLNDDGEGSLRNALNQRGPRTVIFRTSGTIVLKSDLVIEHGDVTIAGQSAPGDGICIRDCPTVISADNVIIRFLRFRLGDETKQEADAIMALGRKNIIIDHCSMSWGVDENASFYDNRNFTLQWSIISESLNSSHHSKGPHGYGGIWGGTKASFHHNLIAHNSSRNPRFNGGRTSPNPEEELVDFRNNVIYNWGFRCAYGGEEGRQNVVANFFKPGPASKNRSRFLELWDDEGQWYVAENVVDGSPGITADNWVGVFGESGDRGRVGRPFEFAADSTQSAGEAYQAVLEAAGAVFPRRDSIDKRIVKEVRLGIATYGASSYTREHKIPSERPHGIIDSQAELGGWPLLETSEPPADSDHDGIPDQWELQNGLNPNDPQDGRRIGESGYSNLELYLNWLVVKGM